MSSGKYKSEWRSYKQFFGHVMTHGSIISDSRLEPTREVLNASYKFMPGQIPRRRNMNRSLGYMELLMCAVGEFSVNNIAKVAPKAKLEFFTENSAYGPRIYDQIFAIIKELKENPASRRAILILPRQFESSTPDLPCTSTIQYFIRNNALISIVNMRSWDLWLGLQADVMLFGGMAKFIRAALRSDCGPVIVNAGSAHIYESQWSMCPNTYSESFSTKPLQSMAYHSNRKKQDYWKNLEQRLREEILTAPWKNGVPACFEENRFPSRDQLQKILEENSIKRGSCKEWIGNRTPAGYGVQSYGAAMFSTHVVSYELEFGTIPYGLVVDHKCKNKPCFEPDHLEAISQKENVARR